MNTQEAVEYTIKVMSDPASLIPADMSEIISIITSKLNNNEYLNELDRKGVALALFGYSMTKGPDVFDEITKIVELLGVGLEFSNYCVEFKSMSFYYKLREVLHGK